MATLVGFELRWHKRSNKDGSGKLSVVESPSPGAVVPGALFSVPEEEKGGLDRVEGLGYGYGEREVSVTTPAGTRAAVTYVASASHVDDSLIPFSWYRDLAADGAASLGLPREHVEFLRGVPCHTDPDREREAEERAFMPCGGVDPGCR